MYIALFHGDFVDYEEIPWTSIINDIKKNNFTFFANLSGIFSFCFYEKKTASIKLISDKRAQDPLYYYMDENQFIFSTELLYSESLSNPPIIA